MIFSNPAYDVDHNTAPPPVGSPYESVRKVWSLLGRYHQDPVQEVLYAPIGPRLLITVGHIAAVQGWKIDMQGKTYTVTAVQPSAYRQVGVPGSGSPGFVYTVDAVYVTVDQDIPQWFRRVQDADIPNITPNNLLLHIGGGAGGQVVTDAEGWLVCQFEPDYARSNRVRWSIQRLDYFGAYNPFPPNPVQPDTPPYFNAGALFKHFDALDGHPETASPQNGDSGSPMFVNCGPANDPWVFIGCVSGPGSRAVSPYKGDVQAGTFAAMSYLDDATIRQLNGEVPPSVPTSPATSTLRQVMRDVNTAVIIYDYQTAQWQPIHRGESLAVREWFVATVDGVERLCCVTEDGYLNLYEESDAGDQVFNPSAPNFLSLTPVQVKAVTRGYTGGSAGFKAGQFARLVLATRAPKYSVESATEGVSETSKVATDRVRDHRVYDRPAGVKRWQADNVNHDFYTPWRQDYSIVLESKFNPLALSTGETLDMFSFLSLDLKPDPIPFDLDKGVACDLMQEANHSLRLVRQRGRWHQAIVSNEEGIVELRAVELELQETSRQIGIKV